MRSETEGLCNWIKGIHLAGGKSTKAQQIPFYFIYFCLLKVKFVYLL